MFSSPEVSCPPKEVENHFMRISGIFFLEGGFSENICVGLVFEKETFRSDVRRSFVLDELFSDNTFVGFFSTK